MAADATEVANLALAWLGEDPIDSIDNTENKTAVLMKALYSGTVYEILSIMPWNCAVKRGELALSAEPNLTNFNYTYDLPDDLIRVLDINGERECMYRIEGQQIYSNEGEGDPSTIKIRYISKLDDPTKWDELLESVIVIRLAEKACMRIAQSLTLTSYLQQQVLTSMTIAQQSSSMEDREDISNILSQLGNAKLADILLAKNNHAVG